MKTGKTLSELATELMRQQATKKDYIADTRALQLRVGSDDQLFLDGINGGLTIRPTAHEQLSQTLGIPKAYYDRLMQAAPDLLCRNVNHWLTATPARKMVRTLDGGVRAILSDRFRALDNLDLAEAVLPQLQKLEANVVSGEVTESRFFLKAVTPKVQAVVDKITPGQNHNLIADYAKGDIVQAGLVISNSEIGAGMLKVEEMTYRLICLNGAIHEAIAKRRHVGRRTGEELLEGFAEYYTTETQRLDDKAIFSKIKDAVAGSLTQDRLNAHILQYQGAQENKIEGDIPAAVEVVAKNFGLGETQRGNMLRHLIEGGDLSAWGLGNALTKASQDEDSYENATQMEYAGAKVFEMSRENWKKLLA